MILFKKSLIIPTSIYLASSFILTIVFEDRASEMFSYLTAWLVSISLVTFYVMSKDKLAETFKLGRTENGTLLWLGLAGGFPMLIISRHILRHKVMESDFVKTMWKLFAFQIFCVIFYLVAIDPKFMGY